MLQPKINDFVQWSCSAFDHLESGRYADALTNVRKAGEAGCKLILINAYPGKLAEEKISNKSFRELIEVVKQEGLIEKQNLHLLYTLQIYGNMSAHDNRVAEKDARYSVQALELFSEWLFVDCMKGVVPSELKTYLSKEKANKKEKSDTAPLNKEIYELKKINSSLEEQLRFAVQDKKIAEEQLHGKLLNILSQIDELKQSGQKTSLLEEELARAKKEMETLRTPVSNTRIQIGSSIFSKKNIRIAVPSLVLLIGVFVIAKFFSNTSKSEIIDDGIKPSSDTVSILILPFSVLQDNPNVVMKFEENLKRKIMEQSSAMKIKIPFSVIFEPSKNHPPQTFEEALSAGEKENATMVIYGDIYELNEGAQVNAKWLLVSKSNQRKGEIGIKSFKSLSDSKADTLQQEITCIVNFALTGELMFRGKYSDALAVLYKTVPISNSEKKDYYDLIASCQYYLKNYDAAEKEVEKYLLLFPKDAYGLCFKANIFKQNNLLDSAEKYYEKSLSIEPARVNTLTEYADMLAMPAVKNYAASRQLLLEALKHDSVNTTILQYLGDLANYEEKYSEAEPYYRKSIKAFANNLNAQKNLAQVVGLKLHRAQEGIKLLEEVLKKDSTDQRAYFLLGNIYTAELNNGEKGEFYFKKSKQYSNAEDAGNYFGLGYAAYQKKDYKTAEENYLKSYRIDSNNFDLCNNIAQLYIDKRNFPEAKKYLFCAKKLDSLNWLTNFNLGTIYTASSKPADLKIAEEYFEKALITNPYDIYTLQFLSSMKYTDGNVQEAKKLLVRLVEVAPNNNTGNKLLGYLFMNNEADYQSAKPLLEKAIAANPSDYEAYSYLAVCTMRISKNTEIQKALQYAKKSVDLNPNNAECQYRLAEIYSYSNDFIKSKEHYEIAISINPSLKNSEMEKSFRN